MDPQKGDIVVGFRDKDPWPREVLGRREQGDRMDRVLYRIPRMGPGARTHWCRIATWRIWARRTSTTKSIQMPPCTCNNLSCPECIAESE